MHLVIVVCLLNRRDQRRRHDDISKRAELDDQDIQARDYNAALVRDGARHSRYDQRDYDDHLAMPTLKLNQFHFHRLRHELSNYSLLRLRHADGAIVSMHQGGTHWLKFMLASAMSVHYEIPPPQFNHANDIIGGTKDPVTYTQIPRIQSSHTVAPLLFRNALALRVLKLPPCVLLVRDLRACLVSNYRKWETRYAIAFSEYLRGDPSGRRFNSDIWWCIRFLNAWGRIVELGDSHCHIVRYEDMRLQPHAELERIAWYFSIPLTPASIDHGVAAATKSAMAERSDPARPAGEINQQDEDPLGAYEATDRAFISSVCANLLRTSFGYDYALWG